MKRLSALAAMALMLSIAACDDDDDNGLGPEDLASIRIVNASPTTQNLDLFVGNTSLASNIAQDVEPVHVSFRFSL